MKVEGVAYRSVWLDLRATAGRCISSIKTKLPWSLDILRLTSRDQVAQAIRSMQVRGAPLIGAVAAYGLCLHALRDDVSTDAMERDAALLKETRPTAINLRWALDRMLTRLRNTASAGRIAAAYTEALAIADEDAAQNESIGLHGLPLIEEKAAKGHVNVC